MKNPWRRVSSRDVYENPWIKVREDQVITPGGKPGIYGVVDMSKNMNVAVLAVRGKLVHLLKEWSYPVEREVVKVVCGGVKMGEDFEVAGRRELKEELGLTAEKMQKVGHIFPTCGISNEESQIYLATGLTRGKTEFDETEQIENLEVDIDEAMKMVDSHEIMDAPSVVALQHYYLGLLRGQYKF